MYPPTVNHSKETEHVNRLATKYFGEAHVSQDELPLTASEDFSYFLEKKPGCFFMLGSHIPGEAVKTLHTSTYNFNDKLISSGGYIFLRIVEDRLGVKIIKE